MTQAIEHSEKNGQLLADGLDFFHDHKLLAALETVVVPRLFAGKHAGAAVRVWVPGCGTGMMAYAVAMLLYAHAAGLDDSPPIQIFATDSAEAMIAIARKGLYPEAIETAIAPELLPQFFIKQQGKYQLKKRVRDLVVFAVHDLLHDSPFTRLDLIFCADVLSRFDQSTQHQLLQIFHYVLQPSGYLALGRGEAAKLLEDLFSEASMPRLFQRRNDAANTALALLQQQTNIRPSRMAVQRSDVAAATSLRDLHLRLLAQHSPVSVLIDNTYDIVHLSKRDNRLFQIPEGRLSYNLVDIIHEDLRPLTRAALWSAARGEGYVEAPPVWVQLNGASRQIRILARRLHEPEWARDYFLVIFDEHGDDRARDRAQGEGITRDERRAETGARQGQNQWWLAIDQYEIAVESQRHTNDQLRSANEMMQALTEELETNQEQLSTVNEELRSTNEELRRRVVDLTRANNDLNNLIGAADIPTVFLDNALQITRFTPRAQSLFHLIPADLGRLLAHVTHTLEYDELLPDIANVLRTLQGTEREVRDAAGRWYLARLRPYRTADERIDGAVLAFVDITTRKQAEEALRQARDQLELRVKERTHELATANMSLQGQIAERMLLEGERKELLRKLVTLQEDERRRIARELHDQLGQSVSALGIGLAVLANPVVEPQQHHETLARLQEMVVQIDKDMNRLALDLRPTALDDLGLVAAVQYHIERWAERNQIHAEFQASGLDAVRLSGEIESVIYRVVQEGLTNVLKHALAQRVSVILEQRSNQVNVIVEDDGRGFDLEALQQAPNAQRRLGLLGMQERVALVGGTFTIDTTPGVGTTLFARIPIGQSTAS